MYIQRIICNYVNVIITLPISIHCLSQCIRLSILMHCLSQSIVYLKALRTRVVWFKIGLFRLSRQCNFTCKFSYVAARGTSSPELSDFAVSVQCSRI